MAIAAPTEEIQARIFSYVRLTCRIVLLGRPAGRLIDSGSNEYPAASRSVSVADAYGSRAAWNSVAISTSATLRQIPAQPAGYHHQLLPSDTNWPATRCRHAS